MFFLIQCGHCYCTECTDVLAKRFCSVANNRRMIKCPICRSNTYHSELSYVNTK